MTQKQIYLTIIVILLASNLFLGVKYFNADKELKEAISITTAKEEKTKFIEFNKTFITEVLQAKSEVSYDTRLKLDETIKGINDEELTQQWKKFTNSQTEEEAQNETIKLLKLLAEKIGRRRQDNNRTIGKNMVLSR